MDSTIKNVWDSYPKRKLADCIKEAPVYSLTMGRFFEDLDCIEEHMEEDLLLVASRWVSPVLVSDDFLENIAEHYPNDTHPLDVIGKAEIDRLDSFLRNWSEMNLKNAYYETVDIAVVI